MQKLIYAGIGGFIGSALRYGLGGWLTRVKGGSTFPWETLIINVVGCLVIGALAALAETRGLFAGTTRVFVFVGILGGFTTFSTFGYETFQLLREGQGAAAAASIALQLVLGLFAVWAGDALVRWVCR
jgi:CrcB protein